MKNKLIIIVLLVSVIFTSCTDWLDIKPLDRMVAEDYWKTQQDVESSVLNCYRELISDACMERIILGGEIRGDNIYNSRNFSAEQRHLFEASIQPANSYAKWEGFYKVINACNLVIKYAPEVAELDPTYSQGLMRAHLAEAMTLRALVYFYLVRLYKDVPFIMEPYTDDTENFYIPVTSGESILKSMVQDLTQAETYAVKTYGSSGSGASANSSFTYNSANWLKNKGRITKKAVQALLADIYLWQEDYTACIDACNRVYENIYTYEDYNRLSSELMTGSELYLFPNQQSSTTSSYRLSSFYQLFYNKNAGESIFELQFDNINRNPKLRDLYGDMENSNPSLASNKFKDLSLFLSTNDLRLKDNIRESSTAGEYYIFKYVGQARIPGVGDNDGTYLMQSPFYPNWIVYRLPDIYLMKAEALVELGGNENLQEALDLVNIVFMRSNPSQTNPLAFADYDSQDKMQKLVRDERQREFMFEGKRWFDLLRMARREGNSENLISAVMSKYQNNASIVRAKLRDMNALYLPVPESEMKVNPALVQNPYYAKISSEN